MILSSTGISPKSLLLAWQCFRVWQSYSFGKSYSFPSLNHACVCVFVCACSLGTVGAGRSLKMDRIRGWGITMNQRFLDSNSMARATACCHTRQFAGRRLFRAVCMPATCDNKRPEVCRLIIRDIITDSCIRHDVVEF